MKILIANAGSSSLKCQLFDMPAETVLAKVHVERIGSAKAPAEWTLGGGPAQKADVSIPDYAAAMRFVLDTLTGCQAGILPSIADLDAVGFKAGLAKGITGCHYMEEEILAALDDYNRIVAPLHNKIYVQAIRYFRNLLPDTPFIGLFETFFCQDLPAYEAVYPIPREWTKKYGIRKTMGHGASHFYLNHRIAELTRRPREEINVIQMASGRKLFAGGHPAGRQPGRDRRFYHAVRPALFEPRFGFRSLPDSFSGKPRGRHDGRSDGPAADRGRAVGAVGDGV